MTWYTASIIQSIRYLYHVDQQEVFPVYEDFILIEAQDPRHANRLAEKHALAVCQIDDQLRLNGRPAKMCFEGIRKLMEVSEPLSTDDDLKVKVLRTGVELSYSYMEVFSEEDLKKLSTGQHVSISFYD